jgi:hypothetical protein
MRYLLRLNVAAQNSFAARSVDITPSVQPRIDRAERELVVMKA